MDSDEWRYRPPDDDRPWAAEPPRIYDQPWTAGAATPQREADRSDTARMGATGSGAEHTHSELGADASADLWAEDPSNAWGVTQAWSPLPPKLDPTSATTERVVVEPDTWYRSPPATPPTYPPAYPPTTSPPATSPPAAQPPAAYASRTEPAYPPATTWGQGRHTANASGGADVAADPTTPSSLAGLPGAVGPVAQHSPAAVGARGWTSEWSGEHRSAEPWSGEQRPSEQRPSEQWPNEQRSAGQHPSGARSASRAGQHSREDDKPAPQWRAGYREQFALRQLVGYAVGWYAIPGLFYLVWLITLDGDRQGLAGRQFVATLPWLLASVALSIAVACLLRWSIVGWRVLTLSFAAAVIGAGLTTAVHTLAL